MNKVILISGGSDGLGKETARLLAKDNTVVILAPNPEKTEAAAKEIRCDFAVCDVTKWDQIESAVQNTITKHGRIDVLINNAGLWIEGELDQNDPQYIHKVLEVNTLGPIWLTRAVLPQMKSQKTGHIINISSQAAKVFKGKRSVYSATKAAILAFTDSLQFDLPQYGIKTTGIYPGKMNTQMFSKAGIVKDLSDSIDPKAVAQTIHYLLSLGDNTVLTEIDIKGKDDSPKSKSGLN